MGNWFSNRGQVIQTSLAGLGIVLVVVNNYSRTYASMLPGAHFLVYLTGGILFAFGVLMGVGRPLGARLIRRFSDTATGSDSNILLCEAAHSLDLAMLHEFYSRHFGNDVPSLAQMRLWHSRNNNIFQIVVDKNSISGGRTIVASFKVMPLKNAAIPFLELGVMTGTNLDAKYIVKPNGSPSAWYIGDLVSTSRASAIIVMKALRDYLVPRLTEPKPIFARPLTEKGLRMLREFGFSPVQGGRMGIGQVCSLLPPEVDELVSRLQTSNSSRKATRRIRGTRPPKQTPPSET